MASDPLPSWQETGPRAALLDFVARVSDPDHADFVPVPERIAVFDNDGTLWSERPTYFQLLYARDRLNQKAGEDPALLENEVMRAVAEGDWDGAFSGGYEGLIGVVTVSHSGMTVEDFQTDVRDWLAGARHPETGRRYTDMVFAPMLELMALLRDAGFTVWIVTGGGVHFVRAFAAETYGIPPERVVGSTGPIEYRTEPGPPRIFKLPGLEFMDDGPGKPVGIDRQIGRVPIFAAGNSDGDYAMLEYVTSAPGPRFGLLVHHTDAEREFAYDRDVALGALERGLIDAEGRGWCVLDMARDWSAVWPER